MRSARGKSCGNAVNVVSERTVSRCLHGRPRTPWQTWRTFLANHLNQIAFVSQLPPLDASRDDASTLLIRRAAQCRHRTGAVRRCHAGWSIARRRFNAPTLMVISLRITFAARPRDGAPAAARAGYSCVVCWRLRARLHVPATPLYRGSCVIPSACTSRQSRSALQMLVSAIESATSK